MESAPHVPGVEPHAEHLGLAPRHRDLVPAGVHHLVHHAVADALSKVVAILGLVEDRRDDAVGGGAELVERLFPARRLRAHRGGPKRLKLEKETTHDLV